MSAMLCPKLRSISAIARQKPVRLFAVSLGLALLSSTPSAAGCGISVGKITDSSIEIRYDSSSCKRSKNGVRLCLKKAWSTVGACNGGTVVTRPGKTGSYTFGNLSPDTNYKIKARYKKRRRWKRFDKLTTATRPSPVENVACHTITNPVLSDYQGDSVKVSFHSAGGSECNPKAFLVVAKYWYQRWPDGALWNTGSGQFGTNSLLIKGVVEGLVALGIVPEENKDNVKEKLEGIQGTGHKYVALAGTGTEHTVTLGGLSPNRRHYIRIFGLNEEGELTSYNSGTAKTPKKGLFKNGEHVEWGEWLARDRPGGKGDYELLRHFVTDVLTCEQPLEVECRAIDGRDWQETGEVYRCDTEVGGVCINSQQADGRCLDYEVRFLCPAP